MSERSDLEKLLATLRARTEQAKPEPGPGPDIEYTVAGFTHNVGAAATFYLGYTVKDRVVSLWTMFSTGGQPQVWMALDTHRDQAMERALGMVDEVKRYAARLSPIVRPGDALTIDDFLEHLRLRLEGRFV